MKKQLITLIALISSLLMISTSAFAQLPNPCVGWNLGNTLESTWAPVPPISPALFTSASSAGFNTVRIPCAWDFHSNQTTYQIDPSYMATVKQAVDSSLAAGMTVIINDHWDKGWLENHLTGTYNSTLNAKMNSYWSQIATAFSGYDNRLLFAAANEVDCRTNNVADPAKWSEVTMYYQTFVNAVRATGGNNSSRWLVLQGPNTDINETDSLMNTLPTDSTPGRLMVEIHYYDPFQFTLMGADADWGTMQYFWGTGYHSTTLPSRNSTSQEEAYIDSQFQKMTVKFINHGIPVMIGEFGAGKRTNLTGVDYDLNYASTTYWDKKVVQSARSHGLNPFFWSTYSNVFDFSTGAVVDQFTLDSVTQRVALPNPVGTADVPVASGTYKIEARVSGKALEAAGWQTANGTQIRQWTYGAAQPNQLWIVTNIGSNLYKIIGVQSGKSIDISNWGTANGTKVQLWDYNATTNQQFRFTSTGTGYFRITPANAPNSCLDLAGSSSADGAVVQLWTYGGGNNEQWALQVP